jgi:hypothetical protein
MPIAKAVTWLIAQNTFEWDVLKLLDENTYQITITNGNKKAELFYNESQRGAIGMYVNDKRTGGCIYNPEELPSAFNQAVAWLKQKSMAERARELRRSTK